MRNPIRITAAIGLATALTTTSALAQLWTPDDIALGTYAWWDASDGGTITESSPGVVGQWDDKSDNGNNATPISATDRPLTGTRTIGGLNAIEFQASTNDGLQFTQTDSIGKEMWAVFVQDASNFTVLGSSGNTQITMLTSGKARSWQNGNGYSPVDGQSTATAALTNPHVVGWLHHPTRKFSVNGTFEDNKGTHDGAGTMNISRIGTQQYDRADGLIGEIVITNNLLTEDDRQRMEGYLAHKWGLEGSLPGDHPYKTDAPTFVTDVDPPTLDTTADVIPADGATNVLASTSLEATFNEPIALTGAGSITLRNQSGGADLPITLPGDVSISAAVLTITPASPMIAGDEYAVEISNDAIEDLAGNDYGGLLPTDVPNWSFTTDGTAPSLVPGSLAPNPGSTTVAPSTNLSMTFDEDMQVGSSGTVTIHLASDDSVVETVDVAVDPITIFGAGVTIPLSGSLATETDYYVNVSSGALTDLSGNAWTGIGDTSTWSFTTVDPSTLWTPASIGVFAWWDAADATTITVTGSGVSTWADKSGNARDATQGNDSQRPLTGGRTISGLNALEFDNDGLNFTTFDLMVNNKEAYAVFHQDDAQDMTILGGGGNSQMTVLASGKMRLWKGANPYNGDAQSSAFALATDHVGGWLANSDFKRFSVNGTLETTGNTPTGNNMDVQQIGRQQYANADGLIGEIVVTNGTLSTDDRQKMEGYLAHKWGTVDSLPGDHPYKASPPLGGGVAGPTDDDNALSASEFANSIGFDPTGGGGGDGLASGSFAGFTGGSYRVEWSPDLVTPWDDVPGTVWPVAGTGDSGTGGVQIPWSHETGGADKAFYRLSID